MADSNALTINYGKQTYSLLKAPPASSQAVVESMETMSQSLDIPRLAKDLSNLGKCLRLAYCGVVGEPNLQTKVKQVGYDVVDLCDESVHTINEFQRASNTAIDSLQATYEFFVDGLDEFAITNLEEIAKVAKTMAEAATKLSVKFKEEAKKVEILQMETAELELKKIENAEDRRKAKKEAELERDKRKQQYDDRLDEELKAEKQYQESKKSQLEQMENQKFGFFKSLINTMTGGAFEEDREIAKASAAVHEEAKERSYQQMQEAKAHRRTALEEMVKFAKMMERLGEEYEIEKAAAESLHHASTALTSLSLIMSKASRFWQETERCCAQLSTPKMIKMAKAASKKDPKERMEIWDKDSFKRAGLKYYANWVAIKVMCDTARQSVVDAQTEVRLYIRENPNQQQAKQLIKDIAPEIEASITADLNSLKISDKPPLKDGNDSE